MHGTFLNVEEWWIFGAQTLNKIFHGDFHSHGGTPNSWVVFVREKTHLEMDDDWGYHIISGNIHKFPH